MHLAVIDIWKAIENVSQTDVPQAAIPSDKFCVLSHLS